jgi:hypothetical protein
VSNSVSNWEKLLQGQAYGEDYLSHTQCHELYQHFKSGRTSVEDDPKSGRPSPLMDDDRVEKVCCDSSKCSA